MDTALLERLRAATAVVFSGTPILAAYAHGSRVSGRPRPGSDLDIANHIIASENYRFPKDNADSFVVLVEQGLLEPAAQDALRAMACFRDRLVHLSWEVDDESVCDYLSELLDDIARFAQAIVRREW